MKVELKLKPLQVPNFVFAECAPRPRQEGMQEAPKFHLSELDSRTLEQLCDKFRADVFAKAKKIDPRKTGVSTSV